MASRATPAPELTEQFRCTNFATYWPEMLALIVLAEAVAAALVADRLGVGRQIPWMDYYLLWLIPGGAAFVITVLVWLMRLLRLNEQHPIRATVRKLRSTGHRKYVEFLVPVVVMAPFMASFTTLKTLLGNPSTRGVDPALARLDGVFGMQPWQVTHALIGPVGTLVIDRAYFAWFLVMQAMIMAVLFVPQLCRFRAQVLLSFVVSWMVLGTVLAIALPSVGPCYFGRFHQPDLYAGLSARLELINQSYPLAALRIQQTLWVDHSQHSIALGSGISAMPSMHVSVATITALLLRRVGLQWLGAIWLGLIWLGSVHLGWHYASDGLIAIAGTVVIWKRVAWMLGQGQSPRGQSDGISLQA